MYDEFWMDEPERPRSPKRNRFTTAAGALVVGLLATAGITYAVANHSGPSSATQVTPGAAFGGPPGAGGPGGPPGGGAGFGPGGLGGPPPQN